MSKQKKSLLPIFRLPLLALVTGIGIGYNLYEFAPVKGHVKVIGQNDAIFDIRFSPKGGCLDLILNTLAQAKDHVYVHTYSFTSREITEALIRAHRRGVRVRVLADKESSTARYCKLQELVKEGIEVRIDKVSGLAHNKVMIVDNSIVVTGSYNWSAAAEKRNAENILRIRNEKVNERYEQNFFARYNNARCM